MAVLPCNTGSGAQADEVVMFDRVGGDWGDLGPQTLKALGATYQSRGSVMSSSGASTSASSARLSEESLYSPGSNVGGSRPASSLEGAGGAEAARLGGLGQKVELARHEGAATRRVRGLLLVEPLDEEDVLRSALQPANLSSAFTRRPVAGAAVVVKPEVNEVLRNVLQPATKSEIAGFHASLRVPEGKELGRRSRKGFST